MIKNLKLIALFMASALTMNLLTGCEKAKEKDEGVDEDQSLSLLEIIPSVKQVEMTVVVPIHPSSLEYFFY